MLTGRKPRFSRRMHSLQTTRLGWVETLAAPFGYYRVRHWQRSRLNPQSIFIVEQITLKPELARLADFYAAEFRRSDEIEKASIEGELETPDRGFSHDELQQNPAEHNDEMGPEKVT